MRRNTIAAAVVVVLVFAFVLYRSFRDPHAGETARAPQPALTSPDAKLQALAGPVPHYSIDIVMQKGHVNASGTVPSDVPIDPRLPVAVIGWAAGSTTEHLASAVYVVVDGTHWFRATYGMRRPDVAKALGQQVLVGYGFVGVIPPGTLTTGAHAVAIAIVDPSGDGFFTAYSGATLVVAP